MDLTLNYRPQGETHWSCRTMAAATGVSKSTVQQVWSARGLKPHRVETFKFSTDPELDAKLVDVVGLYLDPPEKAVVLVCRRKVPDPGAGPDPGIAADGPGPARDEDPRLRAPRHHHPVRGAGGADRQGHRACHPRHRTAEFLTFLNTIDRESPDGLQCI